MNDTEAFLRKIRENPDDDAPRLVFADYLDEQAQTPKNKQAKQQAKWAGIIRAQIAAERESFADISLWNKWAGVDVSQGCKAATECVPKNVRKKSKSPLCRGFNDEIRITPESLVHISNEILNSNAPFRKLILSHSGNKWNINHDNSVLALFRELDFQTATLRLADVEGICNCIHLSSLTSLSIPSSRYINSEPLPLLSESKTLTSLQNLVLAQISEIDNFRKFIDSATASQLHDFRLGWNSMDINQVYWMSHSPLAKSLRKLDINFTRNTDSLHATKWGEFTHLEKVKIEYDSAVGKLGHFVASQNWSHLNELELGRGSITSNILPEFSCSDGQISLSLVRLPRKGLEAVLFSPAMRQVKALKIYSDEANFSFLKSLSRNYHTESLRSLTLRNTIDQFNIDDLIDELCLSPYENLIHLELNVPLRLAHLKNLASSQLGESLRALSFTQRPSDLEFADFFRDQSNFPNLVYLNYYHSNTNLEENRFARGRDKFSL